MKPINNLPKLTRHKLDYTRYTSLRAGVLVPLNVHFVPGREVTRIGASGFVFSNPLARPLLCPVQIRVQRFFCPISNYYGRLYDDEPGFDRNMKFFTISTDMLIDPAAAFRPNPSSLYWRLEYPAFDFSNTDSSDTRIGVNANRLLSFIDIMRTYYAYSNQDIGAWIAAGGTRVGGPTKYSRGYYKPSVFYKFFKGLRNLEEGTTFTPQLIDDILPDVSADDKKLLKSFFCASGLESAFWGQLPYDPEGVLDSGVNFVMPSAPDALNRLYFSGGDAPVEVEPEQGSGGAIAIPQITRGIKLQNIQDLINAGKKTFTSYMRTFFGRAVEHKNRPVLLDSFQFDFNSSMLNSTGGTDLQQGLGQFVGVGQASLSLPTRRYHFDSFGYVFDILSIRMIHAWTGIPAEDVLDSDFNQLFTEKLNEIGFVSKSINATSQGSSGWWPCWNQYRVGYDTVSGEMSSFTSLHTQVGSEPTWTSYSTADSLYVYTNNYPMSGNSLAQPLSQLFVDVASSNRFFGRVYAENFFVRMSYSFKTLNLVGHRFANSARV